MQTNKSKVRDSALRTKDHTCLLTNEKKDTDYFQTLSRVKQENLIQAFEKEKIGSDILKTLYKKE